MTEEGASSSSFDVFTANWDLQEFNVGNRLTWLGAEYVICYSFAPLF